MWPVALDRLGSVSVNGGRILTLWRRLKIDPCMVVFDLLVVGCGGRGDAAEVSVFEPVAVSFEGDDVGVVDEPVDHGSGLRRRRRPHPSERLVGGDDEAGALIPGRDQL